MAKSAKIGDLIVMLTPTIETGKRGVIKDVYRGFQDGKPRYGVIFDSGLELVTREKFMVREDAGLESRA